MKFIHIIAATILLSVTAGYAQNKPSTAGISGSTPGAVDPPKNFNTWPNVSPTHYNYTRTYVPLLPYTSLGTFDQTKNMPVGVTTMYIGAMGDPLLRIQRNGSAYDLAQPFYTRKNHTLVDYLPYTLPYHSRFRDSAYAEQQQFYNALFPNEGNTAYNKKLVASDNGIQNESSYSAGKAFVGQERGSTTSTTFNTANDQVLILEYNNGSICKNGSYPAGEIAIIKTEGQHNQQSLLYKDKSGRILGKKVYAGNNTWLTTYYLYNTLGRIIFIIPPKASEQLASNNCISNAERLCYSYKYDKYGNLIEKGTPDKDSTDIVVYDRYYRTVMGQTALMKTLGQAQFSIYDKWGRVVITGLYKGNKPMSYWEGIAQDSMSFQNNYGVADNTTLEYYLIHGFNDSLYNMSSLQDCEFQVVNYYDTYDYPALSSINTFDGSFSSEYATATGDETPTPYLFTHGKLTGTWVLVNDSLNYTPPNKPSIVTTFFYDEKGRKIQTHVSGINYEGITTAQYNFAGNIVRSIYSHTFDGNNNVIVDNFIYEQNSGRLLSTSRKIDSHPWHPIAAYQYDQFGRVSQKSLGGGAEVQNYTYNIRGQMIGINASTLWDTSTANPSVTYWSQLCYEQGFDSARYDGSLSGYLWRSTSTRVNAYGYYYDPALRMTAADYNEFSTSGGSVNWNHAFKDFSVSGITFDANGNMLTMNQRGYDMNYDPADIDELAYTYDVGNRVLKVEDDTFLHSPIKDFVNGNIGTTDYTYDADGNLASDANKGINNIGYTQLDLPWEVVTDSGTIKNIYDGVGNLLMKSVTDANNNTYFYRYLGPYVYKNDTLQYILHSEGRTRYLPDSDLYKYDFFVKDHKGNVRTVVTADVTETSEPPTTYTAGFEVLAASAEESLFNNIGIVRDGNPQGTPGDLNSGCMEGGVPDKRVAASILLHGMAGDKFSMQGFSYFDAADSNSFGVYATQQNMMESVLQSLSSGVIETAGEGGAVTLQNINSMITSATYDAYEAIKSGVTDPSLPRAYINILVFDEEFNLMGDDCSVTQVSGPGNDWQFISATDVTLPVNGYVIAYFSNESDMDVCVDNIITKHYKGRSLQEQLYYPHGLLVDLGQQNTEPKNKYLYEGKLLQDELGLELYDYHARQYDPQIGRFWGVDPADQYPSGYTGFGNDPANMIDPSGMLAVYMNEFGGPGPDGNYGRMVANRYWRAYYTPPPPDFEARCAAMDILSPRNAVNNLIDGALTDANMGIPTMPDHSPNLRGGTIGKVGDPVLLMKQRLKDAKEKAEQGIGDKSVVEEIKQEITQATGEKTTDGETDDDNSLHQDGSGNSTDIVDGKMDSEGNTTLDGTKYDLNSVRKWADDVKGEKFDRFTEGHNVIHLEDASGYKLDGKPFKPAAESSVSTKLVGNTITLDNDTKTEHNLTRSPHQNKNGTGSVHYHSIPGGEFSYNNWKHDPQPITSYHYYPGPSPADQDLYRSNNNYYDIVVDPKYIYLYKEYGTIYRYPR